jgi:hypothetical protein
VLSRFASVVTLQGRGGAMDFLSVSGWIMTALGLAVAAVQSYRVKALASRNREQMEMFIEDANYASFEHEIIDEIGQKIQDQLIFRFLVSSHQRGCDLYRNLVDYYLSSQTKFDYDDLRRVCQTPLITYHWQEEFWRGRIAMRPKNKGKEVPSERFLTEAKPRRFEVIRSRGRAQNSTEA